MNPRAQIFRSARERLKIDVRGDVGLAGSFQRIGIAVAGDSLECLAGVAAQMTIVDDQRRAVLIAHPGRDLHDLGVGPPLEHGADGCGAHQRRQQHLEAGDRLGRGSEYQLAAVVEIDDALVPAGMPPHRLVDRQHVEIFVGENDRRAFGDIVDRIVPVDVARARQCRLLLLAQHRIDLDHVDAERLKERRQHPQRAQCVRHHGAAAGPELDQPQHRRRADRFPNRCRPQAEQFAEHLAHFGCGNEIALATQRIARHVIAVLGMRQAQLHISPHRHRTGRFDQLLDLGLQRRIFGHGLP